MQEEAKRFEKDPDHPQGKALKKDVESKITEEGLVGMAIVGGVASIIGGLAFLLMKGKK